ncbi:glycosyl hydrolase family 8 [Lactobacillus sp. CBA3606]|uniref:glycosyl hydrolase family 8 n=1 Tax=Lactobacillus sp. CBA3606 TaxID=2099789 RepID=UPI001F1AA7F0|nr:glycosyl hydrolase family 8 [Lactobacillus sp. CBA3606]
MKGKQMLGLVSGSVLVVALIIFVSVGHATKSKTTKSQPVTTRAVRQYNQWCAAYLSGSNKQQFVKTNDSKGALKTVSEAQGYGMLATILAAQQGARNQATFNRLYHYYQAHQISAKNPLMMWEQQQRNGQMNSVSTEQNSATDGDLDIAYALILADKKWGSTAKNNYRQAANQLLAAIQAHEMNPTTYLPRLGSWATGTDSANLVRTSDLMTTHFKLFATFTKATFWQHAATNSQRAIAKLSARTTTGLFPDMITISGANLTMTAVTSNHAEDNQYAYNACRVPWRLAATYATDHDAISKQALQKMLTFFANQSQIKAVYQLDGTVVGNYQSVAFKAPIAYAAQVMRNATLTKKIGATLTNKINSNDYYATTLQVLTSLAADE